MSAGNHPTRSRDDVGFTPTLAHKLSTKSDLNNSDVTKQINRGSHSVKRNIKKTSYVWNQHSLLLDPEIRKWERTSQRTLWHMS